MFDTWTPEPRLLPAFSAAVRKSPAVYLSPFHLEYLPPVSTWIPTLPYLTYLPTYLERINNVNYTPMLCTSGPGQWEQSLPPINAWQSNKLRWKVEIIRTSVGSMAFTWKNPAFFPKQFTVRGSQRFKEWSPWPAGLSPTSFHLSPSSFHLSPSSFHLSPTLVVVGVSALVRWPCSILFMCLPGLSLLSALCRWPCSISILLSPRSVTGVSLSIGHEAIHLSPRSVTAGAM